MGDDGLGGEVVLDVVSRLERGDTGDEGVVAAGLGAGEVIGRRENGVEGSDEVVLGVGWEDVGEIVGCGNGAGYSVSVSDWAIVALGG